MQARRRHLVALCGLIGLLALVTLADTLFACVSGAGLAWLPGLFGIPRVVPQVVVIHRYGEVVPVEPDSPHFAPLAAGAEQVMRRATRSVAALAEVWVVAERYQQEHVVLEVVFAEPGVRAGPHGSYTAVLIPLDESYEPGQVSIFLGRDRYTTLVTAHADGLLAALCKLIGVPAPAVRWGPASPTVAPREARRVSKTLRA